MKRIGITIGSERVPIDKKYYLKHKKLQNKKGYLLTPCNKYPKSYAIKHWNLGGSWIHHLNYVTYEDKRR